MLSSLSRLPARLLSAAAAPAARRRAWHLLALAAVVSLVLVSAFGPTRQPDIASSAAVPDPADDATPSAPNRLEPAQVNLDLPEAAPLVAAALPAIDPNALPLWVRTTQNTTLWSTSSADAGVAVGGLPIRGYLKPL